MLSRSRSRLLNLLIKITLGAVLVAFVAYETTANRQPGLLWERFTEAVSAGNTWILCVVIALIPLNWLMEALKWRLLMGHVYTLSLRDAYRGVLGGLTLSILTPNRIGEYGGRILFVPARYNWYAVVATVTGSFAQNLVIIVAGLAAAIWWMLNTSAFALEVSAVLQVLVVLALCGAVVLYFTLPLIAQWSTTVEAGRLLRKPLKALGLLRFTSSSDLARALGLSLLKYIIFSTQFILLLTFFGVSVPLPLMICGVAMMYLFQTSIPFPPFLEVILRSQVVMLLWSMYEVNELSILAASFCIWILNLVVPAFFGVIAVSSVNVLKSLGYESGDNLPHIGGGDHPNGGTVRAGAGMASGE